MTEKEELKNLMSLDNDEEKVAKEIGLLRPLDVRLIFLFLWISELWYEKHGRNKTFSSDEFYRQLEDDYGIRKEEAEEAVYRLERHGLIREVIEKRKTEIPYLEMFNLPTLERMGIPRNRKEQMSEKEFKELMYERMRESHRQIEAYRDMKKASEEVREAKEDIKRFQESMLRNMISIFAIFVGIVSFVIIGANTAISIPPGWGDLPFYQIFQRVFALLLPIFLFLWTLLFFAYLFSRK
jgi:hypothetical protein